LTFTAKDWRNDPDPSTPINAAALEDMEGRLAAYTDSSTVNTPTVGQRAALAGTIERRAAAIAYGHRGEQFVAGPMDRCSRWSGR
jgi:hypothetical protein